MSGSSEEKGGRAGDVEAGDTQDEIFSLLFACSSTLLLLDQLCPLSLEKR